jgi:hypothetical protein
MNTDLYLHIAAGVTVQTSQSSAVTPSGRAPSRRGPIPGKRTAPSMRSYCRRRPVGTEALPVSSSRPARAGRGGAIARQA